MAFETAWGTLEGNAKIGAGVAVVAGGLYVADRLTDDEDRDEPKPQGIARRVSPAEARRIRRNIEKQRGR